MYNLTRVKAHLRERLIKLVLTKCQTKIGVEFNVEHRKYM